VFREAINQVQCGHLEVKFFLGGRGCQDQR
jgi:hypothetical protein